MKKALATILALVMAIGLCSVSWADEGVTTAEALNTAVGAGGEIKLGADISATITIPADKTVTLNLNGKTLTGSIVNKGKLTVTGTGKVVATAAGTAAVANFPDGTVTLSGGTYESANWYVIKNMGEMYINGPVNVQKPDGSTDTSSLIDNGWYGSTDTVANEPVQAQADKAKLFISSGNFNGKSGAKSCSVVKNDDYGVLEISGGTFDSTANTGTDNAATLLNWNVATISGGTFKGMYPISNGAYAGEADKGQITITGGEFFGTSTIFGMGVGGNAKGSVTVSGGTFTAPALGAGYENLDGGYTLTVSGGTFKNTNGGKVDVSDYLENGKQQNADGSVSTPSSGGYYYYQPTTDTKTTDTKGSPKTFDAGIALYVGMALTSAAGVAFVGKKRED
jgi:hypothetical protein